MIILEIVYYLDVLKNRNLSSIDMPGRTAVFPRMTELSILG